MCFSIHMLTNWTNIWVVGQIPLRKSCLNDFSFWWCVGRIAKYEYRWLCHINVQNIFFSLLCTPIFRSFAVPLLQSHLCPYNVNPSRKISSHEEKYNSGIPIKCIYFENRKMTVYWKQFDFRFQYPDWDY